MIPQNLNVAVAVQDHQVTAHFLIDGILHHYKRTTISQSEVRRIIDYTVSPGDEVPYLDP